tara:strand:+ start:1163 stop:2251 length:1089 start_codon:yes stop_codon:yes gene_type:complete
MDLGQGVTLGKFISETIGGDKLMGDDFEPVTGLAAWYGSDFIGNKRWNYCLSKIEIDEIKVALAKLQKKCIPFEKVTSKEFRLPCLSRVLNKLVDEVGNGRGFIVIKGIPVDDFSEHENKLLGLGLCSYFGNPMPQSLHGDWVNHVIDVSDQKKPPKPELEHILKRDKLRTNHRGGELDFHTDTTDIFALLCLRPAKKGGTSRLVSAATLYNIIGRTKPDYLKALLDGYYYMSQADDDIKSQSRRSNQRIPVFTREGSRVEGYYISQVVQRAMDHSDVVYSEIENDAREELQRVAEGSGVAHEFDLEKGDLLLANNHTVFHARHDYEDHPEVEKRRHLLRLWMANTTKMMSRDFLPSSTKHS